MILHDQFYRRRMVVWNLFFISIFAGCVFLLGVPPAWALPEFPNLPDVSKLAPYEAPTDPQRVLELKKLLGDFNQSVRIDAANFYTKNKNLARQTSAFKFELRLPGSSDVMDLTGTTRTARFVEFRKTATPQSQPAAFCLYLGKTSIYFANQQGRSLSLETTPTLSIKTYRCAIPADHPAEIRWKNGRIVPESVSRPDPGKENTSEFYDLLNKHNPEEYLAGHENPNALSIANEIDAAMNGMYDDLKEVQIRLLSRDIEIHPIHYPKQLDVTSYSGDFKTSDSRHIGLLFISNQKNKIYDARIMDFKDSSNNPANLKRSVQIQFFRPEDFMFTRRDVNQNQIYDLPLPVGVRNYEVKKDNKTIRMAFREDKSIESFTLVLFAPGGQEDSEEIKWDNTGLITSVQERVYANGKYVKDEKKINFNFPAILKDLNPEGYLGKFEKPGDKADAENFDLAINFLISDLREIQSRLISGDIKFKIDKLSTIFDGRFFTWEPKEEITVSIHNENNMLYFMGATVRHEKSIKFSSEIERFSRIGSLGVSRPARISEYAMDRGYKECRLYFTQDQKIKSALITTIGQKPEQVVEYQWDKNGKIVNIDRKLTVKGEKVGSW